MRNAYRGLFISFFFFAFLVSPKAEASWATNPGFQTWMFGGGYGWGWGGGTVAGDYLRGAGVYVDALGRMHVNNAIATQYMEEAYRTYLENRQLRQQIWFQMRDDRDARVAARRKPRLAEAERLKWAKVGQPARLAAAQRDPKTGAMAWPDVLKTKDFAQDRKEIEKLFTERAENPASSGFDSENYSLITEMVDTMMVALKAKIRNVPSNQFLLGSKFLRTLRYEAGFKP